MAPTAAWRTLYVTLTLFAACLVGCQEAASPQGDQVSPAANGNGSAANGPGAGDSISIQAPGVDVQVDGDDGVSIDAPAGVKVRVDKQKGASIVAPGTDVDVKEEAP